MASPALHQQPHWFSTDRPIPNRAADRLSRSHFAESMARAIEGWTGKDSLVIALYGRWGMGKTSIKNMVVDAIQSNAPPKIDILEFNPWEVANRDQLTELFFDELSIAIEKGSAATSEIRKRLVSRLRRYATRLKAGANLAKSFVKIVTIVFGGAGVLTIAAPSALHTANTVAGILLLAVTAALILAGDIATSLAEYLGAMIGTYRKSLGEIKDELVQDLARLSKPLLVIMDDADRLTPSELQQLFQLVKVNADFPNVVYLMMLDREVAAEHLGKVLSINGADYLDKIVQVPFDVPVLSRPLLQKILLENLDRLLADCPQSVEFDKGRWGNLFVNVLQHFFDNLRQANRFLSTFAFHLSVFRTGTSLEVNPIDLIAIEVVRVFEPKVYAAIAMNKEALTSLRSLTFENTGDRTRVEQSILGQATSVHKEKINDLLTQLFPLFGSTSTHHSFFPGDSWQRELRICAEEVFDRYFNFSILEGDISQARIDVLLASAGDREELGKQLRTLYAEGLLDIAMDRLDAYKEAIPPQHALPFVTAIFDIGDLLSENAPGIFGLSPAMHGSRIVHWYLKLLPTPEQRAEVLRGAIEKTTGLALVVHFLMIQQQAAEKQDATEGIFLNPNDLNQLKQLCVRKIQTAASTGELEGNRGLIYILYRWRDWGNPKEVVAWCEGLLNQENGVLVLLKAFTHRSLQVSSGDFIQNESWFIRLKELETFVSLNAIDKKLKEIATETLTAEDNRAINAYRDAVSRRTQGKKDFGDEPFS